MKARIMKQADECILIYGFDNERTEQFRKCAAELKTELRTIPPDSADEQIGYLVGFAGFSSCGSTSSREEECVIFSCIDGKKLNRILDTMRACGLGGIPLKAAVTAYNQKMTLSELIDELRAEHEKMHGTKQEGND